MININQIDDWLDKAQLISTKTDGKTKYDFNRIAFPLKFPSKIYRRDLTLQEAEDASYDLQILTNKRLQSIKSNKKKRKRWYLKVCKEIA